MTTPCFLVALDEGPEADRVLACAITLAVPSQAHLVLFHVRDDANMNPWSYTGQAIRNARQTMQACLAPVQAAGLSGEVVLAHGTPWKEICATAAEYKVALIVLGRGRRTGTASLLGSVSTKVVRQALCSVLVVPV